MKNQSSHFPATNGSIPGICSGRMTKAISGTWAAPTTWSRSAASGYRRRKSNNASTWPTVKECAAFGVNDKDGLTMIKAFVVLKDGANLAADELEQVKRFCKTKLDPRKYPAVLEMMRDLPKTGQGKIDRRLLRQL